MSRNGDWGYVRYTEQPTGLGWGSLPTVGDLSDRLVELGGLETLWVWFAWWCMLSTWRDPGVRAGNGERLSRGMGRAHCEEGRRVRVLEEVWGMGVVSSLTSKSKPIVLSGAEGRRIFFKEKNLHLYETFQGLFASISSDLDPHQVSGIVRRMSGIQKPDTLQLLIPLLLSDCQKKMDSWGAQAILDPSSAFHEIAFQMVMRPASFDIAEDPALLSRLKPLIDTIESPSSESSWLPSISSFRKVSASARIYGIIQRQVHNRKSSGSRRRDALQQMLDDGESTVHIFGFMLGLSLAGARAMGTTVTWLIMYLASDPHWSAAIQNEIETLISAHAVSPSQTLTETLSSIPLQAWETQLPMLDLCIRETLRIAQPYTAVRKNVGPEFTVGPYTIPSGASVVYPFSDTSINPQDYPNPMRWDPSRAFQGQFIGWGAGKHACKGQRLGTLSMKLLVASVLLRYRITLEMQGPPVPDWSSTACRPMEKGGIQITAQS
ncbi:uncharacterized protein N7511_007124 [Penicillium nucicola]|uniref:uncharacterized protein n=1 Tax=Penicillium nucicola TaxID=1850975 RepID=UPI0025454B62|nr:uncharacterized protein N7511_007124 [Penicillium nucicola]KAJ5756942.1 hypothetical protein N7511_007124 [Penicillium nucicola]